MVTKTIAVSSKRARIPLLYLNISWKKSIDGRYFAIERLYCRANKRVDTEYFELNVKRKKEGLGAFLEVKGYMYAICK